MSDHSLRVVFAGTPDFAAIALESILADGWNVVAVYTQPDRPAGRGKKSRPGPVARVALDNDIPLEQPLHFKTPVTQSTLAGYQADVMVVAAYGLILPQSVLDLPRLGCINIHASLLPRWRGAAPIQRAIEAGDPKSGVCIMQMEAGLDTGPVLLSGQLDIRAEETGGSLHDRLAELGATLINTALQRLDNGTLEAIPQDDSAATYAAKLSKEEGQINWQQSAVDIERRIRAFNPWPGSWTQHRNQILKVQAATTASATAADSGQMPGTILGVEKAALRVQCGDGVLEVTHIQLPGKRAMSVADILNGRPDLFASGEQFGEGSGA